MSGGDPFTFNYAIVRRLPKSIREVNVDFDAAEAELASFVDMLRLVGVTIMEIPADEVHPQSTFIEDHLVVINNTALICNGADKSRIGEISVLRSILSREFNCVVVDIDSRDARVVGGDVLFTGKEIIVGLSGRTNLGRANEVAKAFPDFPTTCFHIPSPEKCLRDGTHSSSATEPAHPRKSRRTPASPTQSWSSPRRPGSTRSSSTTTSSTRGETSAPSPRGSLAAD